MPRSSASPSKHDDEEGEEVDHKIHGGDKVAFYKLFISLLCSPVSHPMGTYFCASAIVQQI